MRKKHTKRKQPKKWFVLPGSKSLTNRNLVIAALADGTTVLHSVLESDDTMYCVEALRALGIKIEQEGTSLMVHGGVQHLAGNDQELFLWASGTSMRFLTWLSVLNKEWSITLTGTERLCERPLKDLVDGIIQLGLEIDSNDGCPPVTVHPGEPTSKEITMNGESSSQYFTAMMMVGPYLPGWLTIHVEGELVSKPYIDMTIAEMEKFWAKVVNTDYKSFRVMRKKYQPQELTVEGDASALSYIAAYITLHGWRVDITNIGSMTHQGDYRFLDELMWLWLISESDGFATTLGCNGILNYDMELLRDQTIDMEAMPDVSLTYMILALFLPGVTTITGLQTLNLKECRRIEAMATELRRLWVEVSETEESIQIGELPADYEEQAEKREAIEIETYDDHRIAMSFWVLMSYIGWMTIMDPGCVGKTYPNFWEDIGNLN